MSTRRAAALLLAVLLAVLAAPASAQDAPPPGLGIRLVEAPTARADDPRARSYIVDRVRPGQSFTRRIEVSNGDPEPMEVLLYATAATITDGDFAVGDRGAGGSVASWFSVEPSRLRLEPGTRAEATVRVEVPRDAPDGEAYGAVVVERPAAAGAVGVQTGLRAAIRVYLSVGEGAEPPSDLAVESVTAGRGADGRPTVEAVVVNTGQRALDLSGDLSLTDGPGKLSAGPFPVEVGTTLGVGQSAPVSVALDEAIRGGPWTATLTVRSGSLERRARAEIAFPDQAGSESAPVPAAALAPAEDPDVVVPVAIGVLAVVAALLLLVLLRRRSGEQAQQGPQVAG